MNSYHSAVEWIALWCELQVLEKNKIRNMEVVLLTAHLFEVSPDTVADSILNLRMYWKIQYSEKISDALYGGVN